MAAGNGAKHSDRIVVVVGSGKFLTTSPQKKPQVLLHSRLVDNLGLWETWNPIPTSAQQQPECFWLAARNAMTTVVWCCRLLC
ncbi:MAG: hypothetical protein FWD31_03445 [Planctomycetaceae bacterium]|nr:hypothetical protein [Planctomycetaceae bacterium]